MRLLIGLVIALAVAGGLLLGLRLVLPRLVHAFVFYPEPLPPGRTDPASWGWPEAEEVRLEAADGTRLHGWLFPAAGTRRGAALYLHGNAGNVSIRGESASALAALGLDVLVIDYRGYGASEGAPTEAGLVADARGAWRWWVRERRVDPEEIVLVGGSLGGAVAVEIAARQRAAGLILIAPLPGTIRVAKHAYPFLPGFVFAWREPAFDAVGRMGDVEIPTLLAYPSEDAIIPRSGARAMADSAGGPVTWHESEGFDHSTVWGDPTLWRAIDGFLGEVLRHDDRARDDRARDDDGPRRGRRR